MDSYKYVYNKFELVVIYASSFLVIIKPCRFEEWKKNLPDFEWIKDAVPKNENLKKIRDTLISAKDRGKFYIIFIHTFDST